MAYVINGGERPTSRFQLFVDLCCQAYNLIRKHSGLFLNLLALVGHACTHFLTFQQCHINSTVCIVCVCACACV